MTNTKALGPLKELVSLLGCASHMVSEGGSPMATIERCRELAGDALKALDPSHVAYHSLFVDEVTGEEPIVTEAARSEFSERN
jgi:hypothetical protein